MQNNVLSIPLQLCLIKVSFPDYEQTPSSHSKKTVVIKTVETKDGEVKMFLLKHTDRNCLST